jgi:thiol-disulfide isomerase/thioredoxin
MKILLTALCAAFLLSGCVGTSKSNKPLVIIAPAPEFNLKNILGGETSSQDLKGKIVVVDFWATWCVPCKIEIPEYNKLRAKLKDQGVEFLGVTFDSPEEEAKQFVKEFEMKYPVVWGTDGVNAGFGGVNAYPTTFLVGRDWKIYRRFFGSPPNKIANLEKDILALLAKPDESPTAQK